MPPLNYSYQPRMRLMSVLEEQEPPIQSLELGSTTNTEPTGDKVHVPRELIGNWSNSDTDPFPDFEGIKGYAQADTQCWAALDAHIRDEDYVRVASTHPWPVNSETVLEMMLKTHFDCVNLALERTRGDHRHIMIAGGKSATAVDDVGISSEPDRASFIAPTHIYQSDEEAPESLLVYCFSSLNNTGAKKLQNVVPGEIKLWYKFRREFLDAVEVKKDGSSVPNSTKREQAEQVFTQIYQYMNERHSAIGYLITDQELICVRRVQKERYGVRYGVMDITSGIPLSVKRGHLNAKMALWYLHHKYSAKEPELGHLRRTPKPRNWLKLANSIRLTRNTGVVRFGLRPRKNEFEVDPRDVADKEYGVDDEEENTFTEYVAPGKRSKRKGGKKQ